MTHPNWFHYLILKKHPTIHKWRIWRRGERKGLPWGGRGITWPPDHPSGRVLHTAPGLLYDWDPSQYYLYGRDVVRGIDSSSFPPSFYLDDVSIPTRGGGGASLATWAKIRRFLGLWLDFLKLKWNFFSDDWIRKVLNGSDVKRRESKSWLVGATSH